MTDDHISEMNQEDAWRAAIKRSEAAEEAVIKAVEDLIYFQSARNSAHADYLSSIGRQEEANRIRFKSTVPYNKSKYLGQAIARPGLLQRLILNLLV